MNNLSKIIFTAALILINGTAVSLESTDYKCLNDCTSNGSMYAYCKSKCSYDISSQLSSNIDYTCQNNCIANGYMYSYCKQACSY